MEKKKYVHLFIFVHCSVKVMSGGGSFYSSVKSNLDPRVPPQLLPLSPSHEERERKNGVFRKAILTGVASVPPHEELVFLSVVCS